MRELPLITHSLSGVVSESDVSTTRSALVPAAELLRTAQLPLLDAAAPRTDTRAVDAARRGRPSPPSRCETHTPVVRGPRRPPG